MRRFLFYLSPIIFAIGVFLLIIALFYSKSTGKGALQVTSIPKSKVYLDGKYVGETPLCDCDTNALLPVKSYDLKLIPEKSGLEEFDYKIDINPSVLTVVDRTFGPVGKSSGSVITLDKLGDNTKAQIFIASFPYSAKVSIDGENTGTAPLTQTVTASDHDITVSHDGYSNKDIKIHSVDGYKLDAIIFLATSDSSSKVSSSPIASPSPTVAQSSVKILETPTGFLRVRDNPSLGGNEVGEVNPGEIYPLLSEQSGWYEIKLSSGSAKSGWISSTYAQKQ